MTQQGLRQASVRTVTGTAYDYNGDFSALFDLKGIAAGDFNGRMLSWLNLWLSASYDNLPGAMAAFAAANGATNFSAVGTFDANAGGGGGGYSPSWIEFDGKTFLRRASGLLDVVNSPKGILSYWAEDFIANADDSSSGARVFDFGDANYSFMGNTGINFPQARVGGYFTNADYSASFDFDSNDLVLSAGARYHVLMSWDLGFDPGSRRLAIYVTDQLTSYYINVDSGDASIAAVYQGIITNFASGFPGAYANKGKCADVYLNLIDTIVDADNTISDSNRRKFITADLNPANPTGFPPNAAVIFTGDAESFASNFGSGGSYEIFKMFDTAVITAPGPGPVSCPGLRVGQPVSYVYLTYINITASFESVITVDDQIQQIDDNDLTESVIRVTVPGVLSDTSAP